ncbi:hypothetical protein ACLKMH_05440 [Psychromonas sp. KJ10-10]|uniref:hypothetical protein n=1 Tax=Psychromonas sp. KJ10-10 TaxID=3391823 RepID=UPI0039B41245
MQPIDAQTTVDLMAVIHDCQKQGKTIITVVHDLALVNHFFPNTILLAKKLISSGETHSVMTGENLSSAGYQHLAYMPHKPSELTAIIDDPDTLSSNVTEINSHCSNPTHYEESK